MEKYFYTTLEEIGQYIINQNGVTYKTLQEKLGFNFFDTYDIFSILEKYHVLGAEVSSKPREVLMTIPEFEVLVQNILSTNEKNYKYKITSPIPVDTNSTTQANISINKEHVIDKQTQIDFNSIVIHFFNTYTVSTIQPNTYFYYFARNYIINGKKYDTYSVDDVNAIPIPAYNIGSSQNHYYNIEYLLKRRASQERQKKNYELSYALMYKSIEFMKLSKFKYLERDYMHFIMWLYKDGRIDEATSLENKLHSELPEVFEHNVINNFFFAITDCKRYNCDYIECVGGSCTCGECAKYINRVYCISGKDTRFPKLPEFVFEFGGFHRNCKESFYRYKGGNIRDKYYNFVDAIEYSNRPFVDDRTPAEIENYNKWQKNITQINTYVNEEKEFFILRTKLPNVLPKTFATFEKYKRTSSPKYIKILEEAKQQNITSFLFD